MQITKVQAIPVWQKDGDFRCGCVICGEIATMRVGVLDKRREVRINAILCGRCWLDVQEFGPEVALKEVVG